MSSWWDILKNVEYENTFEYGPEPTLEQYKESQVT